MWSNKFSFIFKRRFYACWRKTKISFLLKLSYISRKTKQTTEKNSLWNIFYLLFEKKTFYYRAIKCGCFDLSQHHDLWEFNSSSCTKRKKSICFSPQMSKWAYNKLIMRNRWNFNCDENYFQVILEYL